MMNVDYLAYQFANRKEIDELVQQEGLLKSLLRHYLERLTSEGSTVSLPIAGGPRDSYLKAFAVDLKTAFLLSGTLILTVVHENKSFLYCVKRTYIVYTHTHTHKDEILPIHLAL